MARDDRHRYVLHAGSAPQEAHAPAPRPAEASSKTPVSVLRQTVAPPRKRAIDPRFDRAFGAFNEDLFAKSYSFVSTIQADERAALKKAIAEEGNAFRRQFLKKTLDRLDSMKKTKEAKEAHQKVVRDHRRTEAALVEEGKSPFYLKKGTLRSLAGSWRRRRPSSPLANARAQNAPTVGDVKKLHLAADFERVKDRIGSEADLDRFIEKKRKRKASKQRRLLRPKARTDTPS